MLSDERLEKIDNLIRMSLNEDTSPTKNGIAAVNARVYAVKVRVARSVIISATEFWLSGQL